MPEQWPMRQNHITIPRPHVPFGPEGVPERIADADYIQDAAWKIEKGYPVGGSNVTRTVVNLLHSVAESLRRDHDEHAKHWWACAVNAPRPEWVGPCDCDLSRQRIQDQTDEGTP
jgi:hypothetical protein